MIFYEMMIKKPPKLDQLLSNVQFCFRNIRIIGFQKKNGHKAAPKEQ